MNTAPGVCMGGYKCREQNFTAGYTLYIERPLFTPQSHVRHFFIVDGCALLDLFWTDEEKHPPIAL